MDQSTFEANNRAHWNKAVDEALQDDVSSMIWTEPEAIKNTLEHFIGSNLCHVLYPTGGGLDWDHTAHTPEDGCLAMATSARHVDVFMPAKMTLEKISEDTLQSFLLLELKSLAADPIEAKPSRERQELLEVPGQGYLERWHWDAGYIGHDEQGREIAIPEDARLVSRWLRGSFLLTSKASLWNADPSTYDARHSRMDTSEIRAAIENAIR